MRFSSPESFTIALPNFDLGYPISLQRRDGKIVTVYYFNLFDRYYIAETTWDLPARTPSGGHYNR